MDWTQVISLAKGITSPKQAVFSALQLMEKKNPQQARLLAKVVASGKSPTEAIAEFARNGELNLQQLDTLKGAYNKARGVGLKLNVPEEVWSEARQIISSNQNSPDAPSIATYKGGF